MSPIPQYNYQPNLNMVLRADFSEIINWDITDDSILEEQVFTSANSSNALGQILTSISTDGSIHKPTFNHSGQLKQVEVKLKNEADFSPLVTNINYNEKGQRESIHYGNGVKTKYTYEEKTYRLSNLKSTRLNAAILQDIFYTYDPVGNITFIKNEAQQTIFFDGQIVNAENEFTYDAFYQLISASGREHIGQTALQPILDQVDAAKILPHKGDGQAMRNYVRRYDYDKAGNMNESAHVLGLNSNSAADYIRKFKYDTESNRLTKSGIGNEQNWQNYNYDLAGNTQQITTTDSLVWNYKNEISKLKRGTLEAHYQYDSSGERVRKIVKKGNILQIRYYLGGTEVYREYKNGKLQSERETLHIMDDVQRICMIDRQTFKNAAAIPANKQTALHRYQIGNHLGSASIELDENAKVISYEEFYPYGSTSYQAVDKNREVARKRYRYTGMERDEESGLNYHSARYYAPWLCRWLKPDPAGTVDGLNVWRYVRGNPVGLVDPSGNAPPEARSMPIHVRRAIKQGIQAHKDILPELARRINEEAQTPAHAAFGYWLIAREEVTTTIGGSRSGKRKGRIDLEVLELISGYAHLYDLKPMNWDKTIYYTQLDKYIKYREPDGNDSIPGTVLEEIQFLGILRPVHVENGDTIVTYNLGLPIEHGVVVPGVITYIRTEKKKEREPKNDPHPIPHSNPRRIKGPIEEGDKKPEDPLGIPLPPVLPVPVLRPKPILVPSLPVLPLFINPCLIDPELCGQSRATPWA